MPHSASSRGCSQSQISFCHSNVTNTNTVPFGNTHSHRRSSYNKPASAGTPPTPRIPIHGTEYAHTESPQSFTRLSVLHSLRGKALLQRDPKSDKSKWAIGTDHKNGRERKRESTKHRECGRNRDAKNIFYEKHNRINGNHMTSTQWEE